ncbi:MAG: hypothetical protein ACRDQB_16975, partial [Thermocrispum sp.]
MAVAWVLVLAALLLAGGSWFAATGSRLHVVLAAAAVGSLGVLGALVWWGDGAGTWSPAAHDTMVVLTAVLATAGGGPVTMA